MNDVSVKEITQDEATRWLTELKLSGEEELRRNYKSAFENYRPSERYVFNLFLINIDGSPEAIARVKFPNSFSSLARVVLKRYAKKPGWLYAKTIIEEILSPQCRSKGINVIYANTWNSKGGRKAFEDLSTYLSKSKCIERIERTQFGSAIFLKI